MGSYNSQYESYYSKLANRKATSPYSSYGNRYNSYKVSSRKEDIFTINYITKKLMRDLIGVLCLFIIVVLCKVLPINQTRLVYTYCKRVVSSNYDLKPLINTISSIKINELQEQAQDGLEVIKSKLTGAETLKEKLNKNYIMPVQTNVISVYGETINTDTVRKKNNKGIEIDVDKASDVKASFNGVVKEVSKDKKLGLYVLIDHGDGIETKYGYLSETLVQVGSSVNKGDIIARSGENISNNKPQIYFEITYMGQNKNPIEYIRN